MLAPLNNKTDNQTSKTKRLVELVQTNGVFTSSAHTIVDEYGNRQNWLLDLRPVLLSGEGLDLATDLFWEHYAENAELQIAGLELSSIPFVGALVQKGHSLGKKVNGLVIRRSRKKSGLMKRIEGSINAAPIVAVDDLTHSGLTLRKISLALQEEGHRLHSAFVLVSFLARPPQLPGVDVKALIPLEALNLKMPTSAAAAASASFETVWSFRPEQKPGFNFVLPKSSPCLDDAAVYFGTDTRTFYAVDLRTGAEKWRHQAAKIDPDKGIFSSPALYQHTVIYGAYDGNVYALDTRTGQPEWINSEADFIGSSPTIAGDLGLVFVGMEHSLTGQRGAMAALDLRTGMTKWRYAVREYLHGSAVYASQKRIVIFGTNENSVVACDAVTGRELWVQKTDGPCKWKGALHKTERYVAFASHDKFLHVFETDTGRPVFRVGADFSFLCSPIFFGDCVIAGNTDKSVYIADVIKRQLVRRIATDARIMSTPMCARERIYIGNNGGAVLEIDPRDWRVSGRYDLPGRLLSSVAYSEKTDLFYALIDDGRLFAFRRT